MAAKKKQKKSGSPPARPKKGVLATATKKLGKVADYLSSQLSSPQGPQLVTQAATLKTSRDAYVTSVGLATTARTAAEQASANALAAEKTLDASIDTYVRAGGTVAAGNATVLSSLAIDVAATATPHAGPATAPSNVVLSMGVESGECKMKWNRPAGAAAFMAQYKVEPASPSAPLTDWLPAEGFATNKVEWLIDGLPPAATVRGRVRSIGAQIGDWSNEVLGKAR